MKYFVTWAPREYYRLSIYRSFIWYETLHSTTITWRFRPGLHSRTTPNTSPIRARHGVSFVSYTWPRHYCDVIMSEIASQITSLTIVYSTVYSVADQRKHQSYASLAFVWGIHRRPVNSPHKGPVTRKMFPFDDVIMKEPKRTVWQYDKQTLIILCNLTKPCIDRWKKACHPSGHYRWWKQQEFSDL